MDNKELYTHNAEILVIRRDDTTPVVFADDVAVKIINKNDAE